MGEITPAHIAIGVSLFGLGMPLLTAALMFVLQRLFGGSDNLREKVHALELAQLRSAEDVKDHVGNGYATKEDMRRLESRIDDLRESMKQYTDAVTAVLTPIANQLSLNAVRAP